MEQLWVFRCADIPHALERIVPDGRAQLLINLEVDELRTWARGVPHRLPGAVLEGPHERAFVIDTEQQRAVLGVNFAPAGVGAWLPAGELVGRRVDLGALGLGRLREAACDSPDDGSALDRVEAALVTAMRTPGPSPAMAWAAAALDAGARVGAVQQRVGLSPRHFRRRFRDRVGLGPKRWARVRRIQRVVRMHDATTEWADLAARGGFADQAHLIREFRAIVGLRPTEYLARRPGDCNHVVEGTKSSSGAREPGAMVRA